MIAGIDEAGRGPVIGPMVMAIVATDDEAKLKKMGVEDSKLIEPGRREQLFETLKESYEHEIIALDPIVIDTAVLDDEDNLNKLEARTTAALIKQLVMRVPVSKVIVDSPAKDGKKYEAVVRAALDKIDENGMLAKIELQCEIKADLNYPVVGAASILAKVTRDAALQALQAKHGPMGSGYPSDPMTQQFLGKHWQEGHDFFRKSWRSYTRLQESAGQASLDDFGPKAEEHAEIISAFEVLKEHGFEFKEPTNKYEIVRMKREKTTVVRYTTGKILVQGPGKGEVEKLLQENELS